LFCFGQRPQRETGAATEVFRLIVGLHGGTSRHGRLRVVFEAISTGLVLFWIVAGCMMMIGSVLGATLSPTIVLGEFLIRTWVLVNVVPEFLRGARLENARRSSRTTRRRSRWKRREPWFGRAQRRKARWRHCHYARKSTENKWEWADTAPDWWDDWYRTYGRYKFLHVDTYGRHFDEFCRPMSDTEFELLMFGSHDLFSRKTQYDWGFLSLTEPLGLNTVAPSTVRDCFQAYYAGTDGDKDLPIVFDTGATISVSPYENDFVTWESTNVNDLSLRGVTTDTTVKGSGTVEWQICDNSGTVHAIRTCAYYVPNATAQLFSPTAYFRQAENRQAGGRIAFDENGGEFVFP